MNAVQPARRTAVLSMVLPGLGQLLKHETVRAILILAVTGLLAGGDWWLGQVAGVGAAVLFAMLFILPWWALQTYDAFLLGLPAPDHRTGWSRTIHMVWTRAHDIRYLGCLFLLTAVTDLYIIVANPAYSLTIFCTKPAGFWGLLAKAQSPTLHTLIGYGFLRLRRWSLVLYLAYAGFGLLNAAANFVCFGYGRVRTIFLITLAAFTVYVLWRRACFEPSPSGHARL
jgi:hypothetical protein